MRQKENVRSNCFEDRDDELLGHIERFFARCFPPSSSTPLALVCGLSGGSDSTALFHLLRQLASKRPCDLTFVHIDHRWRIESGDEADQLENMCAHYKVRFVKARLNNDSRKGNLEAYARGERLRIFYSVAKEQGALALVLAHHAGDCVEGMLKRIFEGAELSQLGALDSDMMLGGLRVVRPFLPIEKKRLQKWLLARGFEHFEDPSNKDPTLWRGFVRTQLLSGVRSALRKEIDAPLLRLWCRAKELKKMLDAWLGEHALTVKWGIGGMCSAIPRSTTPLLLRHFFRKKAESCGSNLPRAAADRLVKATLEQKSNCGVEFGSCRAQIWRELLFVGPRKSSRSGELIVHIEHEGEYCVGIWRVRAQRVEGNASPESFERSWQSAWRGDFRALLFSDNLTLCLPRPGLKLAGRRTSLAKWWNKQGVPPFLRQSVPVAIEKGEVIDEWLSGLNPLRGRKRRGSAEKMWSLHFSALTSTPSSDFDDSEL